MVPSEAERKPGAGLPFYITQKKLHRVATKVENLLVF